MPKKHKQRSLLTKPSSSAHSNLSLSKVFITEDDTVTKSVNDLIQESRRNIGNERTRTPQAVSSVHPALRAVLDIPTPLSPPARPGLRGPSRIRRIPGPPPPNSWLRGNSGQGPVSESTQSANAHKWGRLQQRLHPLPGRCFRGNRSLQHCVMRAVASQWAWHAYYDSEYLLDLPTKVKENLLSYIAVYSDGDGPNPLQTLFPVNTAQDELDEVTRIDLAHATGRWTSIRRIEKGLQADQIQATGSEDRVAVASDEVPDSWDIDAGTEVRLAPMMVPTGIRFHNLKHLSLAVCLDTKSSTVSWVDLLTLASRLSTITSLSLAYWPQPTYTPNASTTMARMTTTSGITLPTVTYGGTNFYSAFDNDFREAAGILRKLSKYLYCLKWLDLTGCCEWLPALSWGQGGTPSDIGIGPDWSGGWRDIEHLVLAVGWEPAPLVMGESVGPNIERHHEIAVDENVDQLTQTLLRLQIARMGNLVQQSPPQPHSWDQDAERERYWYKQEVAKYEQCRSRANLAAEEIKLIRKLRGQKWINFEFEADQNSYI